MKASVALLLTCFAFSSFAYAESGDQSNEGGRPAIEQFSKLEAAFLYQFTNYIKWEHPKLNEVDTFRIAILGKSSIINELKQIAKDKKAQGKTIEIIVLNGNGDIANLVIPKAHIVVLALDSDANLKIALKKLENTGTLSVTQSQNINTLKPVVNFVIRENRVQFEILRKNSEREKLSISSQLLRLALRAE